ncbi:endonuclease/exonuclease/phosphatase family protein [Vitiosangium sp. GDMCC 1.1324]|uniref:endonuclease/exonuclease/phosphatase family protein n=1 Tax=Vitiosangium sp. (strain GDMCC 1.1324) TaxID=2138576 RepID=UPI000D3917E1|nr:endonuclease/exonuclease/phosphatase family protein [Vitiosangium sp. GDMCC 1.1324]PTL75106.1 hypothetical protein DAT35_56690 [Vitiosangium sp. GDMCC 1.1324]
MRPKQVLGAVLVLAAILVPRARAEASQPLKILQWNMAGAARNGGDGPPVDRLVEKIKELRPDIVSINEVCHSQATFLHDSLAKSGIAMNWHFGRASKNFLNQCNGLFGADAWAGNAVFTTAPIREEKDYWFSGTNIVEERSTETRGFTCLTADFTHPVRVCAIHLDPGGATEATPVAQASAIVDKFHKTLEDWPTLLLGDFNATPEHYLQRLYAPEVGGQGVFFEVDMDRGQPPRGEPTHAEGKLDYIFANSGFFDRRMTARVLDGGKCSSNGGKDCSDHKMLYGEVTLQDAPPGHRGGARFE